MKCRYLAALAAVLPSLAFALTLPALPAGMCKLDASVPEQKLVIDFLTSANAGSNEVLGTFANCDELAAMKTSKGHGITHYGVVLSQKLLDGLPIDRKTYVATASVAIDAKGSALTEAALTGAREAVTNATSGQTDIENPKAVTGDSKGVLFKNDDMVIFGVKQTNNLSGKNVAVASTAAMTLIGGQPVSVNLYAPMSEPKAFVASAETLKPFVSALIAANP